MQRHEAYWEQKRQKWAADRDAYRAASWLRMAAGRALDSKAQPFFWYEISDLFLIILHHPMLWCHTPEVDGSSQRIEEGSLQHCGSNWEKGKAGTPLSFVIISLLFGSTGDYWELLKISGDYWRVRDTTVHYWTLLMAVVAACVGHQV